MAHYAQVNSDNIVVQVLVMDNDMETNDGEQACIDWLTLLRINSLHHSLSLRGR